MPTIPFTVRKLESLKSPASGRVDYWDEDVPGFGLRISAAGKRTWVAMYRTKEGRQRRLKLGTFLPMTLADARDAAREVLRSAQKGKDPAELRDKERSADTVEALGALYIEKHAKPNKKSWENDQQMLKRDVYPAWGSRKARSIRRRDIIDLLDKIFDRGAPGSGAPKGNRNAWKHGRYSAECIAERKMLVELIRESLELRKLILSTWISVAVNV